MRAEPPPAGPAQQAGPLAPLLAAYYTLPPPARGMLLLLGATIGFASMHAVIRIASSEQHAFEIAFFRNLFGLIFIAPFLLRHGFGALRTRKLPLHAARGAVHVSAMMMFFYAVPITPLGTVAALSFTAPLFVTVGAVLLLGEVVRIRRIVALIAGFAGALIIVRPGMVALDPGSLLVLGSSAVWAGAMIIIKLLSRTESSLTITAYMAVFLTPLSSIAAAFVWQWPSLEDLGWFALMGSFGTLGPSLPRSSLPRGRCHGGAPGRFPPPDLGVALRLSALQRGAGALRLDRWHRHLREHALPRLP